MCTPIVNQQSSINNEPGLYIPITNQPIDKPEGHEPIEWQSSMVNEMGGGADISSFSGEKTWSQKQTFVKYRQSQE